MTAFTCRLLSGGDVEPYVVHCAAHHAESGRDGEGYSGPYGRNDRFPADFRERTESRWARHLDTPDWRRAWGVFDGASIVGSGNVAGGTLPAEIHRVNLGLSVLRTHRRRGIGRLLLREIVAWCGEQPSIDWLDLGVFAGNAPARSLFEEFGFQELGHTRDRWRVDGHTIDEIRMTLSVAAVDGDALAQ